MTAPRSPRRLLLIGWDAADWKVIHPLLDAGEMPHLAGLIEAGTMANLATLHPAYSPMLWTSIATGMRPHKHGVLGFSEPTHDGRGVRPVSSYSRRVKAFWNILHQDGLRGGVVGWWPSHPAEPIRGAMVSNHFVAAHGPPEQPWPVLPGAVHPPELIRELAELRLNPNELAVDDLVSFIPRAREIDQEKDRRLASVAKTLAEAVSIQAVATWLMEREPWDYFAVYFDAIDHFCHPFMRYHPPRRPFVPERDFELYSGVVAAAYRFHDQMLGTLLRIAGEETTILLLSDHGFHPDHLRPRGIPLEPAGPAIEHRDFGIFVMRGPGVRRDALIHGATVLDIAPTVLTVFGLPVGEDLDGRPLADAFEEPPEVATIPSWEQVAGDDGRLPADSRLDPLDAREALRQLEELGYIEPLGDDVEQAVARTTRELKYNLAQALQDANRHAEALPLLRTLHAEDPDELRFAIQRAWCAQALGRFDEMEEVVADLDTRRRQVAAQANVALKALSETIRERHKDKEEHEKNKPLEELATPEEKPEVHRLQKEANFNPFAVEYLRAQILLARDQVDEALACLGRASTSATERPGLHLQIGEAYLRLGRWDDAEQSYRKARDLDPDNPHAHLGLCRVYLNRRRPRLAAESALASLALLHHNPMAHYLLGLALARLGYAERAAEALQVAIDLNPNFRQAHERLARLLERRLNDRTRAAEHRRIAAAIAQAPPAEVPELVEADDADDLPTAAAGPVLRVADQAPRAAEPITIVSGLPRSGTSMLMKMLSSGGMTPHDDGRRVADADNPLGYFELEAVKRLPADAGWLEQARGRALKVVAPLLPALPDSVPYQVIFIHRSLDEVLASQRAMLDRLGRSGADLAPDRLRRELRRQVARARSWLAARPGIRVLELEHAGVLRDPGAAARALNDFLGGGLDEAAMAAAVDSRLHRWNPSSLRRRPVPESATGETQP